MFCTVQEITQFTGLKPRHLGLTNESTEEFEKIITDWISQAENLITTYTNNKFSSEVPLAVKNVCIRLTANIVALAQARRDTPLIKHDDWNVSIIGSNIFTDDLKNDLQPFKKEYSNKSDPIDIYTITGD